MNCYDIARATGKTLGLFGLGLLGIVACDMEVEYGVSGQRSDATGTTVHYDPVSKRSFPIANPPSLGEACPGDRKVGFLLDSDSACPKPLDSADGTWRVRRNFAQGPKALRGLCTYEWFSASDDKAAPADEKALPRDDSRPSEEWLDTDCQVVSTLATPVPNSAWETLEQAFFDQVERLSPLPDAYKSESPIVAVIDAAVDSPGPDPSHGQTKHGRSVGLVVQHLTCPEGSEDESCRGHISSHLALPLEMVNGRVVENPTQGGFFGRQLDVAIAISRAVTRWNNAGRGRPLVINLSVGWEADLGGGPFQESPKELPAPARAVYNAIAQAVCSGAVVIAAAGNSLGGPEPSHGPMYPAGWETVSAPAAHDCSLFATTPSKHTDRDLDGNMPLVFSAGGVDGADYPLYNSRIGGRPMLAAPAANVVVGSVPKPQPPIPAPSEWTVPQIKTDLRIRQAIIPANKISLVPKQDLVPKKDLAPKPKFPGDIAWWPGKPQPETPDPTMYTGSSMAAAVVSSAAALVWSYRPELSGRDVMKIIYYSAVDLEKRADYCPSEWNKECPSIRRVSICHAVRLACAGGASTCPEVLPECKPHEPYRDARPPHVDLSSLATSSVSGASLTSQGVMGAPCDGTVHTTPSGLGSDSPCPSGQYYSTKIAPWAVPQPDEPPCTVCSLSPNGLGGADLLLSMDGQYLGVLTNPTLVLDYPTGSDIYDLEPVLSSARPDEAPGDVPVTPGDTIQITDLPIDDYSSLLSATIGFTTDDGYASNDHVVLWDVPPAVLPSE